MNRRRFELKQYHVELLKRSNITRNELEWGAPSIDPKRPFGNGDIVRDMAPILGIESFESDEGQVYPKGALERCRAVLLELEEALQVVLSSGSFEPGTYEAEQWTRKFRKVAS